MIEPRILGIWADPTVWGDALAGSEFVVFEDFGLTLAQRKGKAILFAFAECDLESGLSSSIVIFLQDKKLYLNLAKYTFADDNCGVWNPREITVREIETAWATPLAKLLDHPSLALHAVLTELKNEKI